MSKEKSVDKTCEFCKKWYLNDNNGKECSWNNNEVPKRKDFCSRWEGNKVSEEVYDKNYQADKFEEALEEYLEENEPEVIAEFPVDESFVTLYGPVVLVKGFEEDMYVAEGVWCEKDEDSGEYWPDWSLSWFWKAGERPEQHIYYEQDSIPVSLHNLKHIVGEANVGYVSLEILKEQPNYLEGEDEEESKDGE